MKPFKVSKLLMQPLKRRGMVQSFGDYKVVAWPVTGVCHSLELGWGRLWPIKI